MGMEQGERGAVLVCGVREPMVLYKIRTGSTAEPGTGVCIDGQARICAQGTGYTASPRGGLSGNGLRTSIPVRANTQAKRRPIPRESAQPDLGNFLYPNRGGVLRRGVESHRKRPRASRASRYGRSGNSGFCRGESVGGSGGCL